MAKPGVFMKKHFQDKRIEIYVGDESDWYSYADNESMSYVLIVGTFRDYDDESGTITLTAETGHTMYISDYKVSMFWEADKGFNILKTTTSTIRSGKNRMQRKRDDIL